LKALLVLLKPLNEALIIQQLKSSRFQNVEQINAARLNSPPAASTPFISATNPLMDAQDRSIFRERRFSL
jgi:hypothetical protein